MENPNEKIPEIFLQLKHCNLSITQEEDGKLVTILVEKDGGVSVFLSRGEGE